MWGLCAGIRPQGVLGVDGHGFRVEGVVWVT